MTNYKPQLFSSPSTSCAGPPVSKTVTVISTVYQQSTVYQPGATVTQGTFCPSATTVYPGSCAPSTTTIFQGQGSCAATTTKTMTLTPTACVPQGSGVSCPPRAIFTTTIPPTGCNNSPPTLFTTTVYNCQNPGTSCLSPGLITTTSTIYPPPGPSCPSPPPKTTTITSTYTTGASPGINITLTSYSHTPGPTQYIQTTTTISICPPINNPPPPPPTPIINYKPEECDEDGVPYGPNNPHTRPIISYMLQGLNGQTSSIPTSSPPSLPSSQSKPTLLPPPSQGYNGPPGTSLTKTW